MERVTGIAALPAVTLMGLAAVSVFSYLPGIIFS